MPNTLVLHDCTLKSLITMNFEYLVASLRLRKQVKHIRSLEELQRNFMESNREKSECITLFNMLSNPSSFDFSFFYRENVTLNGIKSLP